MVNEFKREIRQVISVDLMKIRTSNIYPSGLCVIHVFCVSLLFFVFSLPLRWLCSVCEIRMRGIKKPLEILTFSNIQDEVLGNNCSTFWQVLIFEASFHCCRC